MIDLKVRIQDEALVVYSIVRTVRSGAIEQLLRQERKVLCPPHVSVV